MAHDDWRIRIELPDEAEAQDLLGRLGLRQSGAEELADDLREHRLAVSQDGDTVFVYAATGMQAEQAARIIESELDDQGLTPARFVTERWLGDEERWDDEPEQPDVEEELLQRGYAPWEVRVEAGSLREAHNLAEQLRSEGYDVSRTFTYVIAGAGSREEAVELARRVHGEVEPGGELVYEVQPLNPFAVFGGLGT
ncbi:MAG: hypothetical protein M3O92_06995 [Actinomycetota bacterium]|nr:hypothetical protein [Actinomycetota bacterium]